MKRKWITRLLILGGLIVAGLIYFAFRDLPRIDSVSQHLIQPSIRITDRNGQTLYEILPENGGIHADLPFDVIPQCMKDAAIAIEDRNFYQNPGVDIEGIARAIWINITGGETIAGGSTITQQVARNLLLSKEERGERTLRRKLREAVLAWQLSRNLSKDDILALYLNQTYYGGFTYGVEAASQTYFGKPAHDLFLHECALLAGLPQAPSLYDPFIDPQAARERQLVVLGLMEKDGFITQDDRILAEQTPLAYNSAPYPIHAPHFVWIVKSQIDKLFENGTLFRQQSLIVRTTLDLDQQQIAEDTITRRLRQYQAQPGQISQNVNNAALVALDPANGEILALVGSADYFNKDINGAVDMAISPRQSGSAFKPFIYALALSSGWTAATPLLDVTTTFTTHDGTPYVPKNYDSLEHGPVPVREALASSLNVPAVLTLDHVGIQNTLDLANRVGINSLDKNPDHYDLSLALGGGQMSLLELTSAFTAFANHGSYPGRYAILDIHDFDGKLLYKQEKASQAQVFDPRVAWLISDILSDDRARKLGFGLNSTLKLDRIAAVKTGTTTNFHDNWTIGYTPDLTVGVWVGNSNYEAMRDITGLTGAAPIWHDVMRLILQGKLDQPFARPDGIKQITVCAMSGLLPTQACQHTQEEWFIEGTEPTQPDNIYKQIFIDSATGQLANESTPIDRRQPLIVLDLPVQAIPWAHSQGLPLLADLPQQNNTGVPALLLISPARDTTYRVASNFDADAQQLPIRAVANQQFTSVSLYVDGKLISTFNAEPYEIWWPLEVGTHQFWARGETSDGQVIESEHIQITIVNN